VLELGKSNMSAGSPSMNLQFQMTLRNVASSLGGLVEMSYKKEG